MDHPIFQLSIQKSKAILAHAGSLNLLLRTEINSLEGDKLIKEHIDYIVERLPTYHSQASDDSPLQSFFISQAFVSIISEFETFLVDVMSIIIRKHPLKLGTETFKLSEILELGNMQEIARVAAERHINSIMYKKANEYRKSLVDILSAEVTFLEADWPKFVESKARRDLGVHNGWLINDTYLRKVREAGMESAAEGSAAPSNNYFWECVTLLNKLIGAISAHTIGKFPDLELET